MATLFIDFETRSTVDLKRSGVDVYASHPSTDVLCMGFAFDDEEPELWKLGDDGLPFDVIIHVSRRGAVVAHNAPFEWNMWNKCGVKKYGWPELSIEQLTCTMAAAYAMSLPGSLEKASAALGIEKQKDMAGSRVMMQLAQPRSINPDGSPNWWQDEEKFKRLYAYCLQDIEVEREIYKRVRPLSKAERNVWLLDQKINERGIAVDIPSAKAAMEIVEVEKSRLDKEMSKLTNGAVVTCSAVSQLTAWLTFEVGVLVEGVAKRDVIDLLESDALPEIARKALLLRKEAAKSSTAKLSSMIDGSSSDGRLRGIFQYHGSNTGRWAGRRVQPQNFPRGSLNEAQVDEVFKLLGAK